MVSTIVTTAVWNVCALPIEGSHRHARIVAAAAAAACHAHLAVETDLNGKLRTVPPPRRRRRRPTATVATHMRRLATAAATSCAEARGRRRCALPLHLQRRGRGAVFVAGRDQPRVHEAVVQLLEAELAELRAQIGLRKRSSVFEFCFPYVCPEPVLVKRSPMCISGFRKKNVFSPLRACRDPPPCKENGLFLSAFPYDCPEPALVK